VLLSFHHTPRISSLVEEIQKISLLVAFWVAWPKHDHTDQLVVDQDVQTSAGRQQSARNNTTQKY